MTFKFEFMTQTQIGKLFGVSSHKIGDWLRSFGLRDEDGKPTAEAHRGQFCKTAPTGENGYHWVWNTEKTVAALIEAGHDLIMNMPSGLVAPAILSGPFSVRKTSRSEFVIENGDGSICLSANTKMTADVVAQILNVAHKHGVIDRLCRSQRLLQLPLAPESEINNVVTPFEERDGESPSQDKTPRHIRNDKL